MKGLYEIEKRATGNKYGAIKTEYNGRKFDSKKEAGRAQELDLMKKAKDPNDRVKSVEYQPVFQIVLNEKKIAKYICDFKIEYEDGHIEYEDVKGYKKGCAYQLFSLKKKLVEAQYNIEIKEV